MTEEEIIRFFSLYHSYLTELGGVYTDNLIKEILRSLAWSLILFLRRLCVGIEKLYYKVFDVLDVIRSEEIVSFASGLSGYVYVMLVMSLLVTGYRMIATENFDLRKAAVNLVVTILILAGSFSVIGSLAELTHVSIRGLSGVGDTASADQMISESVIDLAYRYEKGILLLPAMSSEDIWDDNRVLTPEDIDLMDVNEKISETLGEDTVPFNYTMKVDKNGDLSVKEFSDRTLAEDSVNWLRELVTDIPKYRLSYARYHVEFGTLLLSVTALGIAYIFSVFKVFAIVFELAFSSLILGFTAVSDLPGGQRLKKTVSGILGCFLTLFAMAVLFRFYSVILTSTLRLSIVRSNRMIRMIAILAYTFAVMDGPNMIRLLLGTDAGTARMGSSLFSIYRGTSMTAHAVSFVAGAASGAMKATGGLLKGSPAPPKGYNRDNETGDRFSEQRDPAALFGGQTGNTSDDDPEHASPAISTGSFSAFGETGQSDSVSDEQLSERYGEQGSYISDVSASNDSPGEISDTSEKTFQVGHAVDASPDDPGRRADPKPNDTLSLHGKENTSDEDEAREINEKPKRDRVLRSRRKEEHEKNK